MENIPLSLYIHFPWCVRKCPYCDFNSFKLSTKLDEQEYIQALIQDLKHDVPWSQDREIISIFMGGGTPSLFSPASMKALLDFIRSSLPLASDCEITMEMNPGAIEYGALPEYRAAGINRLSIGIQSFNPAHLKILGRVHNQNEAIQAVEYAQAAGFDNINLDLMYALPQQTPEQALADLQQAINLNPQHLSWYHLTLEPNTEFYRNPPSLPDEDLSLEIELAGKSYLKKHDWSQYEISAYSLVAARQAKHNKNYWTFGDYLGIGAGAHSKITDLVNGTITRYWKHRTPRNYLSHSPPIAGERVLTQADKITEFMFNVMRLTAGFDSYILQRAGLALSDVQIPLGHAQERGFIIIDNNLIRPTELGLRFQNELIQLFMTD